MLLEKAPESIQAALGVLSPQSRARRMIRYAALAEAVPENESGYARRHYLHLGYKIRDRARRDGLEITPETVDEIMERYLPPRYLGEQ